MNSKITKVEVCKVEKIIVYGDGKDNKMAGSYRHVTDKDNNLIGMDCIDNLGDAYEALEQMYLMIKHLTGSDKAKIHAAWRDGYAKKMCPPENEPLFGYDEFWGE